MVDIRDRLAAKNVRLEDFQSINALLISRGFLSRSDGGRQQALYYVAQRIEDELTDVLAVMYGAELIHDSRTQHFRLLPFGVRDDGLPDPAEDIEIRKELKGSVIKDFVAALLTLKLLYNEHIGLRQIESGGRVSVRVTEFVTTMNVHFKTDLPAAESHRKAIFAKLRKHGVAELNLDNLKDEDAVISIRPEIETLVYDGAIAKALSVVENMTAFRNTQEEHEYSESSGSMSADEVEALQ